MKEATPGRSPGTRSRVAVWGGAQQADTEQHMQRQKERGWSCPGSGVSSSRSLPFHLESGWFAPESLEDPCPALS